MGNWMISTGNRFVIFERQSAPPDRGSNVASCIVDRGALPVKEKMDEQTEGSKAMPKNKECDANAKMVYGGE